MAKSKSFFGLRRGSTKSHTYSILNGQQITKDRVQTVANPKTQKQQFQRAIMATVMAAYSEMKEIEDHAFQGKKKGSENQREFMSRNLVAMRNAFLQYQDNNTAVANQKYFAVGPKTPTVLPAEWILSHGTMEEQSFLLYEDGNHTFYTPDIVSYRSAGGGGLESTVGEIADDFGIVPGMQITFVCVTAKNGPRIYEVDSADYAGYHDWKFKYCRLVFKNFVASEAIVSATDNLKNLVTGFLNKAIDTDKSTPALVEALNEIAIPEGNEHGEIDAEILLSAAGFDETLTGGIGIITSMVDGVERSSSKMQVRSTTNRAQALGLAWNWVPLAWQNAGANLGESDLYLEGGN